MEIQKIIEKITNKELDVLLTDLYEDDTLLDYQKQRYIKALNQYQLLYGNDDVNIYSVCGRSEVGGNHTDHQQGRVLAASINLDSIGIVSKQENIIEIVSDGFNIGPISIDEVEYVEEEKGTSTSLVKGVVSRLKELNYTIGGFKAYITSDVLIGAGLSSSACFEDMIGTIINGLYNDMSIDKITIAKVGQYAENVYFGKPCGLMDQCACIVGGLVSIDFKNPSEPIVKEVNVDFSEFNYSLCIVDAKGSHASLTEEYASIPQEMKKVANYFDQEVLREVDEKEFKSHIPDLRKECGDRSVLRAYHFFNENKRVIKLVEALEHKDINEFCKYIEESGNSSYEVLQNVYTTSDPQNQSLSIALTISKDVLNNKGVSRVHGGGFSGTIQAFVSNDYVHIYKQEIEKIFGVNSCHILKIRKQSGLQVI